MERKRIMENKLQRRKKDGEIERKRKGVEQNYGEKKKIKEKKPREYGEREETI
jgi:hypothetical protein